MKTVSRAGFKEGPLSRNGNTSPNGQGRETRAGEQRSEKAKSHQETKKKKKKRIVRAVSPGGGFLGES